MFCAVRNHAYPKRVKEIQQEAHYGDIILDVVILREGAEKPVTGVFAKRS